MYWLKYIIQVDVMLWNIQEMAKRLQLTERPPEYRCSLDNLSLFPSWAASHATQKPQSPLFINVNKSCDLIISRRTEQKNHLPAATIWLYSLSWLQERVIQTASKYIIHNITFPQAARGTGDFVPRLVTSEMISYSLFINPVLGTQNTRQENTPDVKLVQHIIYSLL